MENGTFFSYRSFQLIYLHIFMLIYFVVVIIRRIAFSFLYHIIYFILIIYWWCENIFSDFHMALYYKKMALYTTWEIFIFFSPLVILLLCVSLLLPFLSAKRSGSQLDSSDMKSIAELTLYHLNLKLNSIAYSTTLITRDGEGFAGYEPYVGSLFKYMPRAIWNAKPTPTSYNGTVAGTPSRRIPELLNLGNSEYANVGTSAFLVSFVAGVDVCYYFDIH